MEKIKEEIKAAIMVGILNSDPNVQAHWNRIPREGDIPTVEEVIVYLLKKR